MLKGKRGLIVFSCMLLQAIPYSMAQNVPPLFIKPLERAYGFDLQQIGYIFTIGAVAAALVSPVAGKFYKNHNLKYVMLIGLIISGLGICLNSFAKNLGVLLIGSAITQIGSITFSGLGIPYLIATWFNKQEKAKALGIAFAGGSIGNFFLQPIVETLLTNYSVHIVYAICGITSIIIGSIIILFLIHPNKALENANIKKTATASNANAAVKSSNTAVNSTSTATATESTDNKDVPFSTANVKSQADKKQSEDTISVEKGIGYRNTLKLKSFWLLGLFYLLIGLAISALSTQYADYFESIGVAKKAIGMIGSAFAIACLIGNLGGGVLFAKFGVRKTMGIAFILQLLALVSIFAGLFNHSLGVAAGIGWAVFYGLNVFSYMSGPAIMMQNLFGMKDTSQILGTFSIFFAVGFAVGNIIFGMFVDKLGFGAGWVSVACYTTVGFLGLLAVMKGIIDKDYAAQ